MASTAPGRAPGASGRRPSPMSDKLGFAQFVGRRVGRYLVILISAALVVVCGFIWVEYRTFKNNIRHVDIGTSGGLGGDQNILLVGDDHRPTGASKAVLAELSTGDNGGSLNTDTMMIMHVPANGASATLISFPRDSWVNIPGHGMNKLNSAFSFGSADGGGSAGGARLLISVIAKMTGLSINHYVRVSLLGFYQIAKVLGPVQVCLNQATSDPLSGTNLPKGVSTLDAKQALSFVRQRDGLPRGDLDREVRQQYFLSVELRKIISVGTLLNPSKVSGLLDAVSSSIETDSGLNLLKFAEQLQNFRAGNLRVSTIPITGTPTITVGGTPVSIVSVNFDAMPAFIASVTGVPTAYQKAAASPAGDVTVTVANGSSTNGAATQATKVLAGLGFRTTATGADTTSATTTIRYPSGLESAAKAVAQYVPGALAVQDTSVSNVTLVLGADGLTVMKPAPATSAPAPASTTPAPAPATTRTFGDRACIN